MKAIILRGALAAALFGAVPGIGLASDGQRCDVARGADFSSESSHALEQYLEWLARMSGGRYGIDPREFRLLISSASPPVIGGRPVEADIGCSWGKRYIYLYKQVLANRSLAETYNTIAREYFRHIQVRRDGGRCDSAADNLAALEAEARDWAQGVAPLCR